MRRMIVLVACACLLACALVGAGCFSHPAPTPPDPQSVHRVNAALLNLLKCPNLNCEVLEDLYTGQEVSVLSPDVGGWVQVRVLSSGREGYVLTRFLVR